jgi:CRISPR-associated protein (TIGR03986 family)
MNNSKVHPLHRRAVRQEERTAIAPYNFVPLPKVVVTVDPESISDVFAAYGDAPRRTGRIECVLTAESPLYVRGGLTVDQVRQHLQAKDLPAFFATDLVSATLGLPKPVLPGSSLRGMLRALVEIASYAKISRVTDRQHYYFRAVAAKMDDPLAQPYRVQLRDVRAGYLERTAQGWAIRPAKRFGQDGYLKVRERDVPGHLGLIRLNDRNYCPQYISVSFTTKTTPKGRLVVDQIDHFGVHNDNGMMATSGNMLETGKGRGISPRKNHAVVGEPDSAAQLLPIAPTAIEDYKASLTDFQRGDGMGANWPLHGSEGIFAERDGRPADGRPIFYCEPPNGEPVMYFGQSPNFRMPYRFPGSGRAATPRDFVPEALRDDTQIDLAEAIFGFVRDERQHESQVQAGRVFITDAIAESFEWFSSDPITPCILATPKPTTFQHYLVQQHEDKRQLRHYANVPGSETVIRGHKLYWHKGDPKRTDLEDLAFLQESDEKRERDTQHTRIRPVASGSRFRFEIHFTNLSPVELGALLWVLQLSSPDQHQGNQYRLKLGMGKPLGMGSVQITPTVWISERHQRYQKLFDDQRGWNWYCAETRLDGKEAEYVAAFEKHILEHLAPHESVPESGKLADLLRIQMLLAMLRWPGPQPVEQFTRYMEIERRKTPRVGNAQNEYKDRPVLPDPLQVETGKPPKIEDEPVKPVKTPPKPIIKAPEIPPVGSSFPGNILNVDETAMLIAIPGLNQEKAIGIVEAEGLPRRFKIGNKARVEVVSTRTQKSGRVIVILKLAPKK